MLAFVMVVSGLCGKMEHIHHWQSKRACLVRKHINDSNSGFSYGGNSHKDENTQCHSKHAWIQHRGLRRKSYQNLSLEPNANVCDNGDLPREGFNNARKFSNDPVLLKARSLSIDDPNPYAISYTRDTMDTFSHPRENGLYATAKLMVDAETPSNGKGKGRKKSSLRSEDINEGLIPAEERKNGGLYATAKLMLDAEIPSNGKGKGRKKSSLRSEDINEGLIPGEERKNSETIVIENPVFNMEYENSNEHLVSSL